MDLKPVTYYLELLQIAHSQNNFEALSTIDNEATYAYGYMNTRYGSLEVNKERYIAQYKSTVDEKHTNASLDRAWHVTKEGQEMLQLKRDIQTMEAILRSVKNKLIVLSIENKQYS